MQGGWNSPPSLRVATLHPIMQEHVLLFPEGSGAEGARNGLGAIFVDPPDMVQQILFTGVRSAAEVAPVFLASL